MSDTLTPSEVADFAAAVAAARAAAPPPGPVAAWTCPEPLSESEAMRQVLAAQQWAITRGHLEAMVAMRSSRRLTDPPATLEIENARYQDWAEFDDAVRSFVALVDDEGWDE